MDVLAGCFFPAGGMANPVGVPGWDLRSDQPSSEGWGPG